MNKDVVYIEPEDDITDVIDRVKSAGKKVVALVPPKKPGVLRSSVNAKLLFKTAKQYDKMVVIVTAEPGLVKIAAGAGLPVAKTLESRPVMPAELIARAKKRAEEIREEQDEELIEDDEDGAAGKTRRDGGEDDDEDDENEEDEDISINSAELDEESDRAEERSKKKTAAKKEAEKAVKIPVFEKYRKWILLGAGAVVLLIVVMIAVLTGIGRAKITVEVKTSDTNFSENVALVTDQKDEDVAAGKLYLEKFSFDGESTAEFEATGERNDGEQAKGKIYLKYKFTSSEDPSVTVKEGTVFRSGSNNYLATSTAAFDSSICTVEKLKSEDGCVIVADVDVVAESGGEKYNLASGQTFENSLNDQKLSATNSEPISGGTDKIVKYVTDKDVENAKNSLSTDEDAKKKLLDQIGDDVVVIDSSYKVVTGEVKSSPAVNETVEDGKKAKLTAKSTYQIYGVDKNSIKKLITEKTKESLGSDQKLYSVGKPFFERYVDDGNSRTAKLKTTYKTGPTVTKAQILEKSKGKKIGEVVTQLESVNGVANVEVNTTFAWQGSIPNDENKITIELKVKE